MAIQIICLYAPMPYFSFLLGVTSPFLEPLYTALYTPFRPHLTSPKPPSFHHLSNESCDFSTLSADLSRIKQSSIPDSCLEPISKHAISLLESKKSLITTLQFPDILVPYSGVIILSKEFKNVIWCIPVFRL